MAVLGACCPMIFRLGKRYTIIFCLWRKDGTWERINRLLSEKVRLKFGKKCPASAGIITAEIYVHVMPGGLEKAISVFDKVVPTKA